MMQIGSKIDEIRLCAMPFALELIRGVSGQALDLAFAQGARGKINAQSKLGRSVRVLLRSVVLKADGK